jgi:DNA-binding CsgD family transcriptional regulator
MGRRGRDVLSVIEAAYAIDCTEEAWLATLAQTVEPEIEQGFGSLAYVYDASKVPVQLGAVAQGRSPLTPDLLGRVTSSAPPEYVQQSWKTLAYGTASQVPGFAEIPLVRELERDLGIRDILAINAFDPSGIGVWVGAPLPEITRVDPRDVATWNRVAAHIATAFRLRRRRHGPTKPEDADAVLTPSGRVEHAEGEAKLTKARGRLRDAALAMTRARGALRKSDPAAAVDSWKALVDASWTLLDHFDADGKRYVLAVRNAPVAPGPESLTERERQVLAATALGRSTKLTAYELGLSASTVRVLLMRAAKKLGVETRRELVALYRAHAAHVT